MALKDFKNNPAVSVKGLDLEAIHKSIKALVSSKVLVGIPASTTDRDDGEPITNASIGYLNELGEPAMNLPARPWLVPGVRENSDKLAKQLLAVAKLAVSSRASADGITKGLNIVGITAVAGIKDRITNGLTPPLAERTLQGRARRGHEDAMWELAWRQAGVDAFSAQLTKPLIDTGNFLKSINYVVTTK